MTIADLEQDTAPRSARLPSGETIQLPGNPALAVVKVPASEHPPGELPGYELVVVDRVFRLPSGQRVLAIRSPRGPGRYIQLEESFLLQFDGRGLLLEPEPSVAAGDLAGAARSGSRRAAGYQRRPRLARR